MTDEVQDADSGRWSAVPSHVVTGSLEVIAALSAIFVNVTLFFRLMKDPLTIERGAEIVFLTALANLILLILLAIMGRAHAKRGHQLRHTGLENERLRAAIGSHLLCNVDVSEKRAHIAARHCEYCFNLVRSINTDQYAELERELKTYLNAMLSMTAALFAELTGEPCAVCLKVCVVEQGASTATRLKHGVSRPNVITLARDDRSFLERKRTDREWPKYPYNDNAGFRRILDDDRHEDWYACDDLRELGDAYFAKNPHWESYYNACLFVPVKQFDLKAREECLGFLCVDNWNGGLNNRRAFHIINGIAQDVYYALRTTSGLIEGHQERISNV